MVVIRGSNTELKMWSGGNSEKRGRRRSRGWIDELRSVEEERGRVGVGFAGVEWMEGRLGEEEIKEV